MVHANSVLNRVTRLESLLDVDLAEPRVSGDPARPGWRRHGRCHGCVEPQPVLLKYGCSPMYFPGPGGHDHGRGTPSHFSVERRRSDGEPIRSTDARGMGVLATPNHCFDLRIDQTSVEGLVHLHRDAEPSG
ncbi:hypothetical protein GCM10012280_67860 [Wenjunlia tyrosinilytica]|uniref:Uncharacterized protein n=1 Tax=Wenjunlia tyrosinilytica TaxID=1544741 RepID=A0A917ZX46_9ACTN|nr:hypothetical protein GCM10012280_67860 [Wenjunlia tyrosinilytica]